MLLNGGRVGREAGDEGRNKTQKNGKEGLNPDWKWMENQAKLRTNTLIVPVKYLKLEFGSAKLQKLKSSYNGIRQSI